MSADQSGTAGRQTRPAGEKVVNLALQGGGSHGAFTWGVLDRLLEEDTISLRGYNRNQCRRGERGGHGRRIGRRRSRTSKGVTSPLLAKSIRAIGARPFQAFDRRQSESRLRPRTFVRLYVLRAVDLFCFALSDESLQLQSAQGTACRSDRFQRVRRADNVKLFIAATNVETAKIKIFSGKDIGVQEVLASTCLPLLMQAVEIDGAHYWDGSLRRQPGDFSIGVRMRAPDILLVHITPAERPGIPTTSPSIMNRMQEISFNTCADPRNADYRLSE